MKYIAAFIENYQPNDSILLLGPFRKTSAHSPLL